MIKTRVIRLRGVEGRNARDQIAFCAFHSFLVEFQTNAGKIYAMLACVASVSARVRRENLGRQQKKKKKKKKRNDWGEGGGGERRKRLPANPTILKNCVRPRTQLLIGAVLVVLIT